MLEKTWYEIFLLSPWTGFFLSIFSISLTIYGITVARGARKAAQDTEKRLKAFDRSIEINRMVDLMSNLKQALSSSDLIKASDLADRLRIECVKIEGDNVFVSAADFSAQISGLVSYFGSVEKHISDKTFSWNVDVFNEKSNQITLLNEKAKGVIRNDIRD